MHKVTERDLRDPRFKEGEPEDYEFREDGSIARKDRWEIGIRKIAGMIGYSRKTWEIEDIIEEVQNILNSKSEEVLDIMGEEVEIVEDIPEEVTIIKNSGKVSFDENTKIPSDVLDMVPKEICFKFNILPIRYDWYNSQLILAVDEITSHDFVILKEIEE